MNYHISPSFVPMEDLIWSDRCLHALVTHLPSPYFRIHSWLRSSKATKFVIPYLWFNWEEETVTSWHLAFWLCNPCTTAVIGRWRSIRAQGWAACCQTPCLHTHIKPCLRALLLIWMCKERILDWRWKYNGMSQSGCTAQMYWNLLCWVWCNSSASKP